MKEFLSFITLIFIIQTFVDLSRGDQEGAIVNLALAVLCLLIRVVVDKT